MKSIGIVYTVFIVYSILSSTPYILKPYILSSILLLSYTLIISFILSIYIYPILSLLS